ncbi:hypothetical protein LV476_04655 [Guyparkeria hydrothermalis]|uniref:LPS-assembly lipoprotein LptE n=1 Tax=Guyparkeria hydrothermalis TaxID=923 RepID=UPI002020681E|nr:LPS assembly lipoprotein LptE [Guyparkeria hydrothermalis]MCL7744241.1 hypothetical protein [Guyparkeria hydrothermalis]
MTPARQGLRALSFCLATAMAFGMVGSLAGCGYHLRGMTEVAPTFERVHVSGLSRSGEVYRTLEQQFANANAQLVEDSRQATAQLVVEDESIERRASVVDPTANVRQYELRHEVTYHIELPDGSRTPTQRISQARNYNYDATGVLASSSNERQIRSELGELVGELLFYRLLAPVDRDTLIAPGEGG